MRGAVAELTALTSPAHLDATGGQHDGVDPERIETWLRETAKRGSSSSCRSSRHHHESRRWERNVGPKDVVPL